MVSDAQKRANKSYDQRMRGRGMVPVRLWIHSDDVEKFKKLADDSRLRTESK